VSARPTGSILRVHVVGRSGSGDQWLTLGESGDGLVHVVVPRPPLPLDVAGTFAVTIRRADLDVLRVGAGAADPTNPTLELVIPSGEAANRTAAPNDGTTGRVGAIVAELVARSRATPLAALRFGLDVMRSPSDPAQLRVLLRFENVGTDHLQFLVDPSSLQLRVVDTQGATSAGDASAEDMGLVLASGRYVDGVRRPTRLAPGAVATAALRRSLPSDTTRSVGASIGGMLELVDPPGDLDVFPMDSPGGPNAQFRLEAPAQLVSNVTSVDSDA